MGIIESRIKEAFDKYKKDGNLKKLVCEVADVADRSVNCQLHAWIMYNAIGEYCPPPVFECVYYDGENGGVYHLLDFDPNGLDKEALLAEIYTHLRLECHIDQIDSEEAMKSVYLLNTNALVKVREL